MDALLSDICIGTSAAPTYFPAHSFTNTDDSGKSMDFNLIDGGVVANNPVINQLACMQKISTNPAYILEIKLLPFMTHLLLTQISPEVLLGSEFPVSGSTNFTSKFGRINPTEFLFATPWIGSLP